jgi:diguanylate cyclase (GGDEF)-like protein
VVLRGAATDVSQEVEATKRVEFLSRHDELTGLPNRYHIKEFLAGQLAKEDLNRYPFAMICLDLDKFKPVNDIFGHSTGDALLGEVASRLKNCVRRGDFVARQGGMNLCFSSATPASKTRLRRCVVVSCKNLTVLSPLRAMMWR